MAKFVLTAQIALQAPRNTSQVVNQIRKQLQGINVNINVNANTRALNNTNNQLNSTAKSARAAEKSVSELGRSLGIAARRFGAIAIATGTFLTLSRAIKTSLGDAIEFERQLVNLSQVTGKTVKDLKDISGEITRLSTGLGVSSDQLLRTSIILAQAGLEAGKTKAALEVLAKTTLAASFDDIESTTEGAIAVLSQFRREAIAAGGDVAFLEQALGAINDVSKKFAVESADLVAVIRRSGGAFEAAGGSLNELLALFTSVRATTRESAETIATGLRTIFTRIQRVDTIRQLQELGIALQDAEGKFVGPFEAIKRISEGLSGLDPRDFRFAAIVEELGGFRQIGKVIPLIKQFAVAQDALNTAQGASGSLAKDAATAQQSLANEFARVREEFQALIRKLVDSDSFNTVARGALEVARALIRITDAIEPLLPLIAGLAAFQVGKGFIPALGALTGVTKRNQGGKIHAFASGGFVPGVGNRDTVPAMMTPGEFVIRKSSVKKIGAENLQKLNNGGKVKDLLGEKASLKNRYNVGEQTDLDPNGKIINDEYKPISITKERLDLDYKKSRTQAKEIFDAANDIRLKTNGSDKEKLEAANQYIKNKTGQLSQNLDKELTQEPSLTKSGKTNMSYLNKIAGAIAENEVKQKYEKYKGYERLLDRDGADFKIGPRNFLEVKNKLETTSDEELKSKALLGYSASKSYKNTKTDIAPSLKIKLLTTNEKDILKKNSGGIVQKFAAGGIVDVIKGKQPVGILTTDDDSTAPYTVKPDYSESFRQQLAVAEPATMKQGEQLPNVNVNQFGLNQSAESGIGKKLRQNLITNAANAVNVTAGQMSDVFRNLGIGINANNLVPESEARKAITGSVVGTMFESLIRGVSNASGSDLKDSGYFDFIGPISDQAAQLFEKSGQINASNYKDAKSGAIKKQNIASKVINQAAEEYGMQGVLKSTTGNARTADSILKELTPQMRADFLDPTKGLTPTKLKPIYKAQNEKELLRLLEDKGLDVQTRPREGGGTLISVKVKDMKEMAVGGAASDTQPAMLTPGEFVVNKQKAQEIGYSTLHKMNKTGKIPGYAKGGVVGYASGGPVTPTANTGMGPPSKNIMAFDQVFAKLAQQSNGLLTSFQVFELAVQELTAAGIDLEKVEKFRYKQIQQDVRSRAAQEKILIDGYTKQQQALTTSNEKLNNLKAGISKALSSMQQFVFLGSAVGSLVAQFSSLDKATADALTETLIMGSTFIGVVGTVADFVSSTGVADWALRYFTKSVYSAAAANTAGSKTGGVAGILPLLTRALINPWTVVVGLIVGALAGAIYFFESRARKAAENLVKASDDILQAAEQGKGGSLESFVNTRLQATAAAQQAPSYIFTGEAEKQAEIKATKDSATALYNMTVASRLLEERLAAVEKNASLTSLEKSFVSMDRLTKDLAETNKIFTDSSRSLRNLTQGTKIEDLSGQTKTSAEAFDKAIKIAQERMSSVLLINSQALQQATEESIKNYDFGISGDAVSNVLAGGLQKILDTANNNIAQQADAQARQILEGAKGKSVQDIEAAQAEAANIIQQAAKAQANNEINIKSQIEAAQKQANSSALITNALIKQREEIQKANGAIKFFASTLEKVSEYNKALESFTSRLSGGISTASVSGVQGIGNLNEIIDPGVFAKQLDKTIAPLGEFGKDVSKNLNSTAAFLDRARKKLLNVRFGEADVQATINELFDGVDISGELKAGITSLIQDAAGASTEGGSTIVAAEFENVISPLINQSEPFRKVVDGLINSQNELISANFSYLTEINKIRQEEIDGQRKLVDIENRLQDRLATVTGKSLSIQQKEAARNARRGFGASDRNSLINNFRSISDAIRTNADAIKKANQVGEITKLQKAQAGLSLEFNNLKGIMEELADQSERASDVMSEIDKERGKRETFGKIVESFVIGGQKERVDIVKQFQGLEFAALTGSFQGLGEEQRKATFSLLDQLASVDDRFKALKQNLLTADAIRAGFSPDAAIAIATQTPKEEKLINELRAIANEEKIFQRVLNENRSKDQKVLLDEFGKLSQEIAKFPNNLKNAISQAMTDAREEQKKIDANKITTESKAREAAAEAERKSQIDANLRQEAENKKHKETMVKMQGLIDALDREREYKKSEMEKNIANLFSRLPKSEQNRIKNIQQKSTGGVVYRASGGSIFKPKGTDTVPAMLTPGEFVMQKSAVNQYGLETMNAINSGTMYAAGGGFIKNKEGKIVMGPDGKPKREPVTLDSWSGMDKFNEDEKKRATRSAELDKKQDELLSNPRLSRNKVEPDYPISNTKNLLDLQTTGFDNNLLKQIVGQQYSDVDLGGPNINEINQQALQQAQSIKISSPVQKTNNVLPELAANDGRRSNQYGEADPQILKELGGTYGQGRNYDPRQQLALGQKRREAEMRKRDIRSGKINPMADRRKAIQEKLETRQGDIATSRYKRQQRSLPSYAREEGWENKRINPTQAKGAMQTAGMAQNPMMAQQAMMNPMMAQRAMANPMMAQQGQGMGAQGFNMEPLMQLKQTFDTLTGVLNNMQMTHQVNVDGSLNINGVNAPQVAEAIKTYLGEFIVGEVKKIIDKQGKDFKGQ